MSRPFHLETGPLTQRQARLWLSTTQARCRMARSSIRRGIVASPSNLPSAKATLLKDGTRDWLKCLLVNVLSSPVRLTSHMALGVTQVLYHQTLPWSLMLNFCVLSKKTLP